MSQPSVSIKVPFTYEASLIPPRCRKEVVRLVRDVATLSVRTLSPSDAPVAITITSADGKQNDDIRWDGNRLYRPVVGSSQYLTWDGLVDAAATGELAFGLPFHIPLSVDSLSRQYATLGDMNGKTRWDTRELVLTRLREMAGSLIVVDGKVWIETQEPNYVVMSFGAGALYSVCVTAGCYAGTAEPECYEFNALQLDQAVAYAQSKRDRDGKTPECDSALYTYNVLIPDAVKMPPNPWMPK